ncbi:UNVERIFIED_CONTAM: hypothetical protein GTU68_008166 [Idotea baltica]|nr:hypothetical protein [Idotea baltica]
MNYLARREHSCAELITKLKARFPDDMVIVRAEVQKLVDENLQSNRRFAEDYLRHRSQRGYGLVHIRSALIERGVSTADIQHALAEESINWSSLAKSVYIKKFGERPAADIKEKAKRVRYMQYRGFASEDFQNLL